MGRIIKAAPTIPETAPTSAEALPSAQIIALALETAERIVADEIKAAPSRLQKIYARVLRSAQGLEGATVYVHPEDRAVFDIDGTAATHEFSVETDAAVGRGGCRIAGRIGEVDASIDALIEAFRETLEEPR